MNFNWRRFAPVLLALFLPLRSQAVQFHCGGIGPQPMNDISATLKYKVTSVNAGGGVKEFLYREDSNSIVFRNSQNDIYGLGFDGNSYSQATQFGSSKLPISQVLDPLQRYVLTASKGWILDTKDNGGWHQYLNLNNVKPLFWDAPIAGLLRSRLYSVVTTTDNSGLQHFQFYSYREGDDSAVPICKLDSVASEPITLAHGASDPYAFFYSQSVTDSGERKVVILPYNLLTCVMGAGTEYGNLRGPVVDVYRYDALDSNAVIVDNPAQNLMWGTPKGCGYYDIGSSQVIVPNDSEPVMGTFTASAGLNLFFLNTAQRASILAGFPITSLKDGDLWLSNSGDRIFLAPLFEGEHYKWLLDMEVSSSGGTFNSPSTN